MGLRYRYGWWRVTMDPQKGINLLKKAAKHEQTHAGACYELASLYLHGNVLEGVSQSFTKALKYAKRGAEANINLFKDIQKYSQKDMVKQNQSLIETIEAIRTQPKYINMP